jgi:hypothetical protein
MIIKRIVIPISILGMTLAFLNGIKTQALSPNLGSISTNEIADGTINKESYFAKVNVLSEDVKFELSDRGKETLVYTVLPQSPNWKVIKWAEMPAKLVHKEERTYLLVVAPKNSSAQAFKRDSSTGQVTIEGYISEPENIDSLKKQMESQNISFAYNLKVLNPNVKENETKSLAILVVTTGIIAAAYFFISSFPLGKSDGKEVS